jgi:succinate dehydrogenase / fumarate reductase flavoprotein subunit
MYERITAENAYQQPMRIYPAPHYAMGGLWVDYNLQSTIPGLFVLGEANFSDHGANRLGASALMQGLADGYFIIPYTISHYLAQIRPGEVNTGAQEFTGSVESCEASVRKILSINGGRTVNEFHRELGHIMWEYAGMARNREGMTKALGLIASLRNEYWEDLKVPGGEAELNQELEKAGRVADFLEFSELLVRDALAREESCGAQFREEYQTPEGEALRDDKNFSHVSAWEYKGPDCGPAMHKEPLVFWNVHLAARSYK